MRPSELPCGDAAVYELTADPVTASPSGSDTNPPQTRAERKGEEEEASENEISKPSQYNHTGAPLVANSTVKPGIYADTALVMSLYDLDAPSDPNIPNNNPNNNPNNKRSSRHKLSSDSRSSISNASSDCIGLSTAERLGLGVGGLGGLRTKSGRSDLPPSHRSTSKIQIR